MDKAWESGAAVSAPTTVNADVGFPTEGDLSLSIAPTNPGAWWFHMITAELLAVLVAAGITPDAGTLNQLLAALDARYSSGASFSGSITGDGYMSLPLGFYIVWGISGSFATDTTHNAVTFANAFPTACFVVIANASSDNGVSIGGTEYAHGVCAKTTTGFQINNDAATSVFDFIAFGN